MKNSLKNLNQSWQKERPSYCFVSDGILDDNVWEKAEPKIMFLLKESADDFVDIADAKIDIRKGNGNHFWWNIAYWKHIINSLFRNKEPEFVETSELPEAFNNYLINDIAYVNIKKNCENKTTSSHHEIIEYALKDKEYLTQQIDFINPNVILCNNTTFAAYKLIYDDNLKKLNELCYSHNNRLIIHYKHPSYFQIAGGRETLFYNLKNSLTEIDFRQFNWSNP